VLVLISTAAGMSNSAKTMPASTNVEMEEADIATAEDDSAGVTHGQGDPSTPLTSEKQKAAKPRLSTSSNFIHGFSSTIPLRESCIYIF
jgi:V8-like Glu-specific endopeptidase